MTEASISESAETHSNVYVCSNMQGKTASAADKKFQPQASWKFMVKLMQTAPLLFLRKTISKYFYISLNTVKSLPWADNSVRINVSLTLFMILRTE